MLTPFAIPEEQVAYWKMAVGYRVIAGPQIFVVVAIKEPDKWH
jgi:hypothetical protein